MKATRKSHALGQRLGLDNITRELLDKGTLQRYISELAITGLQVEGAQAFAKSWKALMDRIGAKRDTLEKVARA